MQIAAFATSRHPKSSRTLHLLLSFDSLPNIQSQIVQCGVIAGFQWARGETLFYEAQLA